MQITIFKELVRLCLELCFHSAGTSRYKSPMKQQTIGLLGGSFDPAHGGHVALTRAALVRFGLDRVWWMVSPGNPLKPHGPAPMGERISAARDIMDHPRVTITDIEARLGTRYTAETLRALIARYPQYRFVWLMGADNLAQFDQWRDWRWIMDTVPIGILARPGARLAPLSARAARIYAHARLPARASYHLGRGEAPAWCYVNMPLSDLSSTALRQGRRQ